MASRIIKTIPKNEKIVLTYKTVKGEIYIITKNPTKFNYVIYKQVGDGYERIGTGNTPPELEKKFIKK